MSYSKHFAKHSGDEINSNSILLNPKRCWLFGHLNMPELTECSLTPPKFIFMQQSLTSAIFELQKRYTPQKKAENNRDLYLKQNQRHLY